MEASAISPTGLGNGVMEPAQPCRAGDIPEEEIHAQVQRIINSPDFVASARNRRFLQHAVECGVQGLKAKGYDIGTKVFGRPETFNPTLDPIVRIEAGKLRRDLETYYLKSGRRDPVAISLPKGRYVAVFKRNRTAATGESPGTVSPPARAILHAALLGWSGQESEAAAAWERLVQHFPDFDRNPQVGEMLDSLHGEQGDLRKLLLEGLHRAGRASSGMALRKGMATEPAL